jgi:hypothetical protein
MKRWPGHYKQFFGAWIICSVCTWTCRHLLCSKKAVHILRGENQNLWRRSSGRIGGRQCRWLEELHAGSTLGNGGICFPAQNVHCLSHISWHLPICNEDWMLGNCLCAMGRCWELVNWKLIYGQPKTNSHHFLPPTLISWNRYCQTWVIHLLLSLLQTCFLFTMFLYN